jgi:hypothetical protein
VKHADTLPARFLELSIATPDIRSSLSFYGKLGFYEADVGDAWPHPYAVVSDGRIVLGLHEHPDFVSSLTFVRPDLSNISRRSNGLGSSSSSAALATTCSTKSDGGTRRAI